MRRATAAGWRNPAWRRHARAHEHDIRDTDAAHRPTDAAGVPGRPTRCAGRHAGKPGGAPVPRRQPADPRGGMVVDGADPRSMGAARLRHVRGRCRTGAAPVGPACCIRWNGRNRSWPIRSISRSGAAASPPKRCARRATGRSRGSAFARLASFILPDNVRSIRVAEKLGAVRDGTTTIRGFAGGLVGASRTWDAEHAVAAPDEPSPVRVLREDRAVGPACSPPIMPVARSRAAWAGSVCRRANWIGTSPGTSASPASPSACRPRWMPPRCCRPIRAW